MDPGHQSIFATDAVALVFNALMLWTLVPTLERWWGGKRTLLFALYVSLAATVTGCVVGQLIDRATPIVGLDAMMFASLLAFGVLYSNQKVQFFGVLPLTGRQMMYGVIGLVTLFILLRQDWVVGASYAGALLMAWLLTNGKWTPRIAWLRFRQWRARRHLRVLPGGRSNPPGRKWMN